MLCSQQDYLDLGPKQQIGKKKVNFVQKLKHNSFQKKGKYSQVLDKPSTVDCWINSPSLVVEGVLHL